MRFMTLMLLVICRLLVIVILVMIVLPEISAAQGQQPNAGHFGQGDDPGASWQTGQGLYQEGFDIFSRIENGIGLL